MFRSQGSVNRCSSLVYSRSLDSLITFGVTIVSHESRIDGLYTRTSSNDVTILTASKCFKTIHTCASNVASDTWESLFCSFSSTYFIVRSFHSTILDLYDDGQVVKLFLFCL